LGPAVFTAGPWLELAVKMSPTTLGPAVKIFTAGPLGTGGENDGGKNSFCSSERQ